MSVRSVICAIAVLILSPSGPAAAQTAQTAQAGQVNQAPAAGELAGLWRAIRRFGPDSGGTLIVRRSGAVYLAEMMGRTIPVRVERGALDFALPDDQGRFRGRLEGGRILGHWIRPGTPANMSHYASPVRLRPDGAGRWRGEVTPLDDRFTLYLLASPRPDGSFGAVLRNPERDFGTQMGASRLIREGDIVRLMGQRPGAAERELARGGYDRESGSFTLSFPGRGGSYDFARAGDDSDFYPRGRSPGIYSYRPPPARGDGWPTGTLAEARIDRAAIERLIQRIAETPMDSADSPQIHGLLIARHGRLVVEEYFHGQHRDRLHDTRSAGKSVAGVAIGAAIQAGAPLGLASPVYRVMNGGTFPAGLEPLKRAMTLEHLLTMSAGYFCDDTDPDAPGNEEVMSEQTGEPDYYRFTLAVPMATPPGENSVYCSAMPNLALGMVGRATGEMPVDVFDRLVARPMAIDNYAWPLDPAGNPYGGGSVQLLPRDFLKFGQLMLNGGSWAGRRILGRDFTARAAAPSYNLRNIRYGYLWWVEDYPYKDRLVRSFSARGAGGQTVTVIPALDLVVATLAGNYSSRTQLTYTGHLVPRSILPAVRERGDDPAAPVADRDFVSPYGRSADGSRVTGRN